VSRYARRREGGEEQRATALELFFDLVFVFAVTQISHFLLDHLTIEGAAQSLLLLMVTWWAWNYTTWVTNELDPDAVPVRLMLVAVMLLSLLMAVAIPYAFDERALLFACSYAGLQILRNWFLAFVACAPGTPERARTVPVLIWLSAAGALWVAGAIADDGARTALWLAALAVDYGGPAALYWLPGRGRQSADVWKVDTAHFAERFQLFIIIALGESIVVTGATTSELDLDAVSLTAFALAFLGSAALWWLYFDYVATIAARRLTLAEDSTRLARDGYTYLHGVMVAGIIVAAVGDELVIAHPREELSGAELTAVVAGPAIYLVAHALFRLRMAGTVSRKRLAGAAGCVAVAAAGSFVSALTVLALVVAVLVAVIASERVAAHRRRARGELTPLERLEAASVR
jgi:low temperature requirement protein LtrA